VYNQHTLACVVVLLDRNSVPEALEEPGLDPSRLRKSPSPHHLPRSLVGHAEDDLAAAFVGKGNAVPRQLVEGEPAGGRLELDTPPFWAVE
jgi:hypothetical protein